MHLSAFCIVYIERLNACVNATSNEKRNFHYEIVNSIRFCGAATFIVTSFTLIFSIIVKFRSQHNRLMERNQP